MTFRSNTMATKAVESYIKLVGKEVSAITIRFSDWSLFLRWTGGTDMDAGTISNQSLNLYSFLIFESMQASLDTWKIKWDMCSRNLQSIVLIIVLSVAMNTDSFFVQGTYLSLSSHCSKAAELHSLPEAFTDSAAGMGKMLHSRASFVLLVDHISSHLAIIAGTISRLKDKILH